MTWKGWEQYAPPGQRRPGPGPRAPRVRGYRPAWVHRDGLMLTTVPQLADGWERFASTREAKRYVELRRLEAAGAIRDLRRQVRLPLVVVGPSGERIIGHYIADFVYLADHRQVIEDAKGHRTDLYEWKRRHVEAQYGIPITEA